MVHGAIAGNRSMSGVLPAVLDCTQAQTMCGDHNPACALWQRMKCESRRDRQRSIPTPCEVPLVYS